jgi:prevent-host-death family protein
MIVNVHDARSRLSELLRAVSAGEEVGIGRNGTPVARLVP